MVRKIAKHPSIFPKLLDFGVPDTPRKIDMEPENTPLKKEKHLPNDHFQVLCWSLGYISMVWTTHHFRTLPALPYHKAPSQRKAIKSLQRHVFGRFFLAAGDHSLWFFWNHGNLVDFFLNSFLLRETKAICCQIVAFHPDPASSWKIRCSFKFRIQKVTSVRWFLTSTCVFSDFRDAKMTHSLQEDHLTHLSTSSGLYSQTSMLFVHHGTTQNGPKRSFQMIIKVPTKSGMPASQVRYPPNLGSCGHWKP